jgi:hypothetical protein
VKRRMMGKRIVRMGMRGMCLLGAIWMGVVRYRDEDGAGKGRDGMG